MSSSLSFRIGIAPNAHLEVALDAQPEVAGKHDEAAWLAATVKVSAGAFSDAYPATLDSAAFVLFRDGLRKLHETLSGSAAFCPIEPWLLIDIEGDGKGHIRAKCVARDDPGWGNALTFELSLDQTELPDIIRGLNAICDVWNVAKPRARLP